MTEIRQMITEKPRTSQPRKEFAMPIPAVTSPRTRQRDPATPDPPRCSACGAERRRVVQVRGFDGRDTSKEWFCPACLEALADALREESRAADYDRRHPWGCGW